MVHHEALPPGHMERQPIQLGPCGGDTRNRRSQLSRCVVDEDAGVRDDVLPTGQLRVVALLDGPVRVGQPRSTIGQHGSEADAAAGAVLGHHDPADGADFCGILWVADIREMEEDAQAAGQPSAGDFVGSRRGEDKGIDRGGAGREAEGNTVGSQAVWFVRIRRDSG